MDKLLRDRHLFYLKNQINTKKLYDVDKDEKVFEGGESDEEIFIKEYTFAINCLCSDQFVYWF